jgi:hypothetical protein
MPYNHEVYCDRLAGRGHHKLVGDMEESLCLSWMIPDPHTRQAGAWMTAGGSNTRVGLHVLLNLPLANTAAQKPLTREMMFLRYAVTVHVLKSTHYNMLSKEHK